MNEAFDVACCIIIHAITGKAVFTASRPANHEGHTGTKLTKTNQNQCIITSKTPPSASSSTGMEALKLLMLTLREAERDGLRRQTETEREREGDGNKRQTETDTTTSDKQANTKTDREGQSLDTERVVS